MKCGGELFQVITQMPEIFVAQPVALLDLEHFLRDCQHRTRGNVCWMPSHIILRRLQQRHFAQHLLGLDKLRRRIFDLDAKGIEQLAGPQIGGPVGTGEGQHIGVGVAKPADDDAGLVPGGSKIGEMWGVYERRPDSKKGCKDSHPCEGVR